MRKSAGCRGTGQGALELKCVPSASEHHVGVVVPTGPRKHVSKRQLGDALLEQPVRRLKHLHCLPRHRLRLIEVALSSKDFGANRPPNRLGGHPVGLGLTLSRMKETSADPAVEWLLQSADPSIRYLTLTEVLDHSSGSPEVQRVLPAVAKSPKVRTLLSGQRDDGGFGVHPYRKWTGAFWRLVALAELAVPSSHPALAPLVDHVLRWLEGQDRGAPATTVNGRVRAHATQDGYALAALCILGMADHPRVHTVARSLVAWQWPDGGWNCDRSPSARHSSFHETHGPIWGLAEFFQRTKHHDARACADNGGEFLLKHALFRSERTGRPIHPGFLQLRFPPYWHYDILQGLWALSRFDKVRDKRASEALDVVEGKRGTDGRWRADGYWWKPPGSRGSSVEIVDWGRRGPNEWVTLRALRVLKSAGRLRLPRL